jgi:hypothetical protein
MHTRSLRNCFLATLVLIPLGSIAWAQDQGREFHWKGKLAPENVVVVKNTNGNIEAQPASGDEVEVTAEKSGPRADEVKIEMVQRPDGVIFCAILPGMRENDQCKQNGDWHPTNRHDDTKVDFTVRVPENIRFSAENVNGNVTANNLGRVVRASSVNGRVQVSTKSWAEVSSVNGNVKARMGQADWPGTLSIETVNGSIELELPGDLSADVAFKSVNGELESDFALTVQGSMSGHSMKGRIGNGGRELKIETVNGSVRLKHNSI